jgi:hypothetical protein
MDTTLRRLRIEWGLGKLTITTIFRQSLECTQHRTKLVESRWRYSDFFFLPENFEKLFKMVLKDWDLTETDCAAWISGHISPNQVISIANLIIFIASDGWYRRPEKKPENFFLKFSSWNVSNKVISVFLTVLKTMMTEYFDTLAEVTQKHSK